MKEIDLYSVMLKALDGATEIVDKIAPRLANFLADKAAELWTLEAKVAPGNKWGEKYASVIKTDLAMGNNTTARVYADEDDDNFKFLNFVENGIKSWSIKDALLKGPAAARNMAKYGSLFVHVPFQYATPASTNPTSQFAGTMPADVYQVVKSGGKIGKEFGRLAGLKKYGGEGQSQYFTFRTVSAKSEGWQYPDKPATPVFDNVLKEVDKMLDNAVSKLIKGMANDLAKQMKQEGV